MSDVMEKISEDLLRKSKDGDHDKFQHYFCKDDIERNMFEGTPMQALCGKVIHQQVDPKGRTICPECQRMMDEVVGSNLK